MHEQAHTRPKRFNGQEKSFVNSGCQATYDGTVYTLATEQFALKKVGETASGLACEEGEKKKETIPPHAWLGVYHPARSSRASLHARSVWACFFYTENRGLVFYREKALLQGKGGGFKILLPCLALVIPLRAIGRLT